MKSPFNSMSILARIVFAAALMIALAIALVFLVPKPYQAFAIAGAPFLVYFSVLAIGERAGWWMVLGVRGMFGQAGAVAPFPVTPSLQAIAIAYRNAAMIADEVLPFVPVDGEVFKYLSFPKEEILTVPETKVGRKGRPNTVEFTAKEVEASTQDHALDDEVPIKDIENAKTTPGLPDPEMRATEGIMQLLSLAREIRARDLVFAAGTYPAGNKVTLAGNDVWATKHADSDPITDILSAIDVPMMPPNGMVLGQSASIALRTHPKVVKAHHGTEGADGLVPLEFIRQLFGLDFISVGRGWVNIAKKGAAVNRVRVWGGHCALIYQDKTADAKSGITFGYTAQWGAPVAGSWYEKDIGMRGGNRIRAGKSLKELVPAPDCGYFIENVA